MCAVWPWYCIEDRIRDHYEGKVCIWVKSMYEEISENFQELYGQKQVVCLIGIDVLSMKNI